MEITIRYRSRDGVERQHRFPSDQEIIIGRPKVIPIQLDLSHDGRVSRPHARLFYRLSAWWVEDLYSKHGVYLNGVRITKPVTLAPHDELRLGDTTLHLQFVSSETLLPDGDYETALTIDEVEPAETISKAQRLDLFERFSKIADHYQNNPHGLLDRFGEELGALFPQADHKVILLEEDRNLMPRSSTPRGIAHVSFTLVREAIRTQQVLQWTRKLAAPGEPIASLHDTLAALCAPILYNGRPIGAIYLDATRLESAFHASDPALLSEVANHVAQPVGTINRQELSRFPRVFLAYEGIDRPLVNRLVGDLRRRRIKVWLDESLQPGQARQPQIASAIQTTDALLALLSPPSVDSPQLQAVLDQALNKRKTIIPLLLQPCTLPSAIADLVPVDFTSNYADAIASVEETIYNLLKPKDKESTMRILFLAANPTDTDQLRLSVEVRTIDARLRSAEFRDRFELVQHWAVRSGDLAEFLLRHRPHIVHFAGHGSKSGKIVLENEEGKAASVAPEALAQLFRILKDNVRLVVLNACLSADQAEAIAKEIDCVVGMKRKISDDAATKFAAGFYRGLGYGRSVQTAFDLGRNEIGLSKLEEDAIPKLLVKPGVNAANVVFV